MEFEHKKDIKSLNFKVFSLPAQDNNVVSPNLFARRCGGLKIGLIFNLRSEREPRAATQIN